MGRTNAVSLIDMETLSEKLYLSQNGEVNTIDFDNIRRIYGIWHIKGYVFIWKVMGKQTIAGPKHDGAVHRSRIQSRTANGW